MRVWTVPAAVLVMAAVLVGCGQKGPLYRDNPEGVSGAGKPAAGAAVESSQADNRESGN